MILRYTCHIIYWHSALQLYLEEIHREISRKFQLRRHVIASLSSRWQTLYARYEVYVNYLLPKKSNHVSPMLLHTITRAYWSFFKNWISRLDSNRKRTIKKERSRNIFHYSLINLVTEDEKYRLPLIILLIVIFVEFWNYKENFYLYFYFYFWWNFFSYNWNTYIATKQPKKHLQVYCLLMKDG